MHILAFILFFIFGSICAAANGDFSGIAVIGKVIGFILIFAFMCYLLMHPVLLGIFIALTVIIAIICSR